MSRFTLALVLSLSLGACKCGKDPVDTAPPEGDTDTDADTDTDTDTDADADTDADTDCTAGVVETTPEDDAGGWYYRDPVEVVFSEPSAELATLSVSDVDGEPLVLDVSWDDTEMRATAYPEGGFLGSSAYTLVVDVCEIETEVTFSTSAYGSELDEAASALEHKTYVLDLEEVTFTEPENFELLLAMFGVNPLLVGIYQADDTTITLYVAEGKLRADGSYKVLPDGRSWLFEPADFTSHPFFSAVQDELSLDYDGTELPIADFRLEGTFAPDGSSIGGVTVSGVADTREISLEYGGDEAYYCDMLGDWGMHCIACEDGEELCLEILAEDGIAPLEPDLDIIP